MSELENSATALEKTAAAAAALLLANYSFDLGGYSPHELVERWSGRCPANWVRLAVIEALYQGRYKAISVDQILNIWLRRNQPLHHFKYEFERLVCNKLPPELQQQFFMSSADLPPGYPQPPIDPVDILHLEKSESFNQATLPSSTSVEELGQPIKLAETLSEPSITVAEDLPIPKNSGDKPVPNKPMLPEFKRVPDRNITSQAELLSKQQVNTIQFSDFANWLGYPPIDQFIPDPPFPDFHTKLKSFTYPASLSTETRHFNLPRSGSKGAGEQESRGEF